jgi:hypothetical protein
MSWRNASTTFRAGRNASPAERRADRDRAEAAGLEQAERAAKLRREKTAKLKKLREDRDRAAGK